MFNPRSHTNTIPSLVRSGGWAGEGIAAAACRAGGTRAERLTYKAPAGIKASSCHAPQRLTAPE